MSSTNKTEYLQLNRWLGSDIPQMEDFNRDNVVLDDAIGRHIANTELHVSAAEKARWNNVYHMTTYYGNGVASRDVAINCSFTPRWGMVFAIGKTPSVTDIANKSDYNYFAIATTNGSMSGVSLSGKQLKVTQSASAVLGNEYRNFNEAGATYAVIVFA